jgi:hypothetical protein
VAAATARRNTNSNLLMQGQGQGQGQLTDQIAALGGMGVEGWQGEREEDKGRGRGSEEKKKDGEGDVPHGLEGRGGGQGLEQRLSSGLQSLAQPVPAASEKSFSVSIAVSPPKFLSEREKEVEREKKREGRRMEKERDRARERVEIRDAVLFDISKPPVITPDSTPLKVHLLPCLCQ